MSEGTSNSVISLGDIAKPADTLIKKVAKAVGGFFEPYQIKRRAKAVAEASIITAQAEIQVTDLQRRAMHRFVEEEAMRQRNIEAITNKALPLLTECSDPAKMDDDWVVNFFDKSRIVSDEEMQSLWSRVLAGEANSPGTYSKRTVNFLADLDKYDAELFSKICRFCWQFDELIAIIFDHDAKIYTSNGITFNGITHLEAIGLIKTNLGLFTSGYSLAKQPKKVTATYGGKSLELEFEKDENNELQIGRVILTKIGTELAPICKSTAVPGFWDYVSERWKAHLPKSDSQPLDTVNNTVPAR